MSEDGWVVTAKDVPVELEHDYPHATFPRKRVEWATFEEKLSAADSATLHLLMNGGTGEMTSL